MDRKKNGFTLVELLGVIVILAIVITIASGSILSLLNRAKSSTSLEMRESLNDAALTYSLENIRLEKCSVSFSNEVYEHGDLTHLDSNSSCVKKIKVSELIESGVFEDKRGYCKREEDIIVYRYNDGVNSEYKVYTNDQICAN